MRILRMPMYMCLLAGSLSCGYNARDPNEVWSASAPADDPRPSAGAASTGTVSDPGSVEVPEPVGGESPDPTDQSSPNGDDQEDPNGDDNQGDPNGEDDQGDPNGDDAEDRDEVLFFTWRAPLGNAADIPNLYPQVLVRTGDPNGLKDPKQVAQEVCERIRDRGHPDTIDIFLQWFGHGTNPNYPNLPSPQRQYSGVPLTWHPNDALDPNDPNCDPDFVLDPTEPFWNTPWTRHGREEARAWMEAFIAEYKKIQHGDPNDPQHCPGDPNLADPMRFHFDNEANPAKGDAANRLFFAMKVCGDRWGDADDPNVGEEIYGFGKTLAELYADFLADPNHSEPHPDDPPYANKPWYNWFTNLCYEARAHAMNYAAYSLISAAWPNCKCSNYHGSRSMDGEIQDPNNVYLGGRWDYTHCNPNWRPWWWRRHWDGHADLQAPYFYPYYAEFPCDIDTDKCPDHPLSDFCDPIDPNDPNGLNDPNAYADACMIVYRHDLEACINSFGGGHADELSPWIALPNWPYAAWQLGSPVSNDKDLSRRLLALLRAKNISEILVYNDEFPNDPNQQDEEEAWDAFADLVSQVWGAELHDATTVASPTGPTGDQKDKVRYSDNDVLEVSSRMVDAGTYRAEVQARFDVQGFCGDPNDPVYPATLRVHVEVAVANPSQTVTVTVLLYNCSQSTWDSIGSFNLTSEKSAINEYFDRNSAADYIDRINSNTYRAMVRVRYTSTSAFTSKTDLVQLVEADD